MNGTERSTIALACALLVSCSGSSENPLADGVTPEIEALLIERTIEQIELAENFTHDTFEQIQRTNIETMAEEMQEAALVNLENRLKKITILELSQTVQLDRESAVVESRIVDLENVLALVTLKGTRTYNTNNATKTSETRFSVPWAITVDDGELVFYHRGVRMRNVRKDPRTVVDPAQSETPEAPDDPPDTEDDKGAMTG
jgi:hypothetical protein